MVTKKKTKKKTVKKAVKKPAAPKVTQEQLKQEADKIANEMLASNGIYKNEEVPAEQISDDAMTAKVDEFFKNLETQAETVEVPLDWQPTMNVVSRMSEAGEESSKHVFFQSNKTIIVKLPKPKYNPLKELEKIKFHVDNSNFKYTIVSEDDSDFVIEIKLS